MRAAKKWMCDTCMPCTWKCVIVHFCIPAAYHAHGASVCPSLCFNSSRWIAFPSYSRACLLYIWVKHSCILWRGARGEWTLLTSFLPMSVCVFVLECYHCACGMEERRWRGFRKSTPNKVKLFQSSSVCSYWISAAPLVPSHSCPLVSHHPSGVHSFCSFMSFLSSCFFFCFFFPRQSTSPRCVYVGSLDHLGSSFLPLPSLPSLYFSAVS